MSLAARRRPATRAILLDRSLESLPLFRLSDSADDSAIVYTPPSGGRWRVVPSPEWGVPRTFDQDVYIELFHRYHEAGAPADGSISFTLHAFLRSIGRHADGRTYEQLRSALARLQHTALESQGAYFDAAAGAVVNTQFTVLAGVHIDRRRSIDRQQFSFFPALSAAEPGEAVVTLGATLRANLATGHVAMLSAARYHALASPVARRLYRLLEVARQEGRVSWRVELPQLAEQLPLSQRYPSHLQRVLQPAHEMLITDGLLRDATIRQQHRQWFVDYVLGARVA